MSFFKNTRFKCLRFLVILVFSYSPNNYEVKCVEVQSSWKSRDLDSDSDSVNKSSWLNEDDISSNFWILVTQAQMNIVTRPSIANGSMFPHLDPMSLIIKRPITPSYRNSHLVKINQSCRQAVEETQEKLSHQKLKNSDNFKRANASYYLTHLRNNCFFPNNDDPLSGLQVAPKDIPRPFPVFHCNQYVGNGNEVKVYFRMEYPNSTSPLPSNLASNWVPVYFLVEVRKASTQKWEGIGNELEENWLFSVNVKTNEPFQIRVTAISTKYIFPPTTSESMTIYDPLLSLESKSFEMNLQVSDISTDGNSSNVSALVRWTSSRSPKEHQASCEYDVFYMDEEACKIKRRSAEEAFWVLLTPLKFGKNYNVRIIEKFRRTEEGNVSEVISSNLQISVPTCLHFHHFSFKFCSPPSPSNVRWGDLTGNSIWIQWDPPKYSNIISNPILYYNVSIEWIYSSVANAFHPFPNYNAQRILAGTVPGNLCSVSVRNVTQLRGQFSVYVKAVGPAGASTPAWNILEYKGSSKPKDNDSKTWTVTADPRILLLVLFGLLASFLSLMLLHMAIICILQKLPQQSHDHQIQNELSSLSSQTRSSSSSSFSLEAQSTPNTRKV